MKHIEKPIDVLGSLSRASSTIISSFILAAVLVSTASATHFRAGQISWTQAGGNSVDVTVQQAWRRSIGGICVDSSNVATPCTPSDGFPGVGDVILPLSFFDWGDGTAQEPIQLLVTSIDPVNDWLFGTVTLTHTYSTDGDYLAFFESCCRISTSINNADGSFSVETLINAGGTNNSPVTALPPIVVCPENAVCEFLVPGSDPDAPALNFRLSSSLEADRQGFTGFTQPGFTAPDVPGANAAEIAPNTGLFTWDRTGAGSAGDLYSAQVTIEDQASKIAVDFFIQLGGTDPNPPIIGVAGDPDPTCSAGAAQSRSVIVGDNLTFDVVASDIDILDTLTLNVAGLPAGASMSPTLPFVGSLGEDVSSTFSWTPVSGQSDTVVIFDVSNFSNVQTLCSVAIEVIDNIIPVAIDDPGNMANSGETINIDVLANDQDLEDDVVSITTTTPVSGGTATVVGIAPNLSVDYTSAGGFDGPDTFTYTITDDDGVPSNSATVSIEVDGSVAVTPAGPNPPPVFGGAAIPGSDVPLSAAGANALTSGTSSVQCCTVRDWRVGAGDTEKEGPLAFKKQSFDIGLAMSNPALADANCADMPKPAPGELVMPRYFGVHTNPSIPDGALVANDFRFGICVVLTDVLWRGPVFLDVVADSVVGYAVNCAADSVDKQPITAARTTDSPEFAEEMRSVSSDCDPKGIGKWSTWYFSPNVQHLTDAMTSKVLMSQMSSRLKDLIEAMRAEGAVDSAFLDDVKSFVLDGEKNFKGGSKKKDPKKALPFLDEATRLALLMTTPPLFDPYGSSASFNNPQGELVSHITALRYGVCSELAFPNSSGNPNSVLNNCEMPVDIVAALPALP